MTESESSESDSFYDAEDTEQTLINVSRCVIAMPNLFKAIFAVRPVFRIRIIFDADPDPKHYVPLS